MQQDGHAAGAHALHRGQLLLRRDQAELALEEEAVTVVAALAHGRSHVGCAHVDDLHEELLNLGAQARKALVHLSIASEGQQNGSVLLFQDLWAGLGAQAGGNHHRGGDVGGAIDVHGEAPDPREGILAARVGEDLRPHGHPEVAHLMAVLQRAQQRLPGVAVFHGLDGDLDADVSARSLRQIGRGGHESLRVATEGPEDP
eukprot:scaffold13_cov241-Pinguiococcus_pyrenoidosus.AAC.16